MISLKCGIKNKFTDTDNSIVVIKRVEEREKDKEGKGGKLYGDESRLDFEW